MIMPDPADSTTLPEREATPDEAFELGTVAGYDEGWLALKAAIETFHRQGGVQASGYPNGWCTHDHHPWPCPTILITVGRGIA